MTAIKRSMMAAAGQGGDKLYVEDVFSTYLYQGNSSTPPTITNNIDLAGEGGMVWIKARPAATNNVLTDTERGRGLELSSDVDWAQQNYAGTYGINSFNSNGFSLIGANSPTNTSAYKYVSWTFRKAEGFFDIVTYTGTGSAHAIDHALGSTPGCIIVKNLDAADAWKVYHKYNTAAPETDYLVLNTTAATVDDATVWNDTLPTSTQFTVGTHTDVNTSGEDYIAYIFADDDESFGADGDESIIKCGSYTGTATVGTPVISLGWEPQYVLVKRTDSTGNWLVQDSMRSLSHANTAMLFPNLSNAATTGAYATVVPTADGFYIGDNGTNYNASGGTYIYMAIRRPMKVPSAGTDVYNTSYRGTAEAAANGVYYNAGFPVDWSFNRNRTYAGGNMGMYSRIMGGLYSLLNITDVGANTSGNLLDNNFGFQTGTISENTAQSAWMFKRGPKCMQTVGYSGTGAAHAESHGLTVVPELMFVKNLVVGQLDNWAVYYGDNTDYLSLNTTAATADDATFWNDTSPTSTQFTVGTHSSVNATGEAYLAVLFATLAGVSKVGTYTADATLTTIDCGFTAGARFIWIKRTDSTGDWYLWDSLRGIVAGNDTYLLTNSTAAEVTGTDYIDPDNSGFQITAAASSTVNVSGGTYIFLAIS